MEIKTIADARLQQLEFDTTQGGTPVAKFAVVFDQEDNNGNEISVWQNCKVYGYLAKMLKNNQAEGRRVSVSGEMEYWEYEGSQYDVLSVDSLRFVDPVSDMDQRQGQSGPSDQRQQGGQQGSQESFEPDDDLPF